jgi:hypothetical protein
MVFPDLTDEANEKINKGLEGSLMNAPKWRA